LRARKMMAPHICTLRAELVYSRKTCRIMKSIRIDPNKRMKLPRKRKSGISLWRSLQLHTTCAQRNLKMSLGLEICLLLKARLKITLIMSIFQNTSNY
jgi:hypothetical protein